MERRERRRRVRFSLEHFPVLNYATHICQKREGVLLKVSALELLRPGRLYDKHFLHKAMTKAEVDGRGHMV